MINKKSIEFVDQSNLNSRFKKPLYSSYNFANLPEFIVDRFLGTNYSFLPTDVLIGKNKQFNKVILFFIDGFGWRFLEKFQDHPFLKFIFKNGVVSKITSQFPSTTSAHVTSIHTGLPVGDSGVYEWFYYEPKVDAIISPLLFSFAGDQYRDSLNNFIQPEKILPKKTFYQKLKQRQIQSFIFQHREYTPSTYSNIVFQGAKTFGYKTLSEALINLFQVIQADNKKSYYFLYFDKIDSIAHQYGPSSAQTEGEILIFLETMEKIFLKKFSLLKNSLFLMTADHGQMEIEPKKTFYVNQQAPKIINWIKTNKNDQYLVPAGSPRDLFLHIKKEYIKEARDYLEEKFKDFGEVYLVKDLINQGFFGTKISKTFLSRVGDLVLLPYEKQSVWWYEPGRFENHFYGHHGGLTKEEMEVGLYSLDFS